MEHVFGRNPMFSGTRKDYYFHYSDLSCSEISKLSCSAMQADVCGDYLRGQTHLIDGGPGFRSTPVIRWGFCRPTFYRTCETF